MYVTFLGLFDLYMLLFYFRIGDGNGFIYLFDYSCSCYFVLAVKADLYTIIFYFFIDESFYFLGVIEPVNLDFLFRFDF